MYLSWVQDVRGPELGCGDLHRGPVRGSDGAQNLDE